MKARLGKVTFDIGILHSISTLLTRLRIRVASRSSLQILNTTVAITPAWQDLMKISTKVGMRFVRPV